MHLRGIIFASLSVSCHAVPGEWFKATVQGYCSVTGINQGTICAARDTKGSWRAHSPRECVQRCVACAQCNFISWDSKRKDCSWFSRCHLGNLMKHAHTRHRTIEVRAVQGGVRAAITTLFPPQANQPPPPPPSPPNPPPPPCKQLSQAGPSFVLRLADLATPTQKPLLMLQIGANVGDFVPVRGRSDGGCSDMGATVAAGLLLHPSVTAILVEASPSNFRKLESNLATASLSNRHHAVNAAVCSNVSEAKTMIFYTVSPEFADEFPDAPFYAKTEINSFDRGHVLGILRWVMGEKKDQAARFITATPVSCLSPRGLLRSKRVKAAQVDVMIVDTEKMDLVILQSFLSQPSFRPSAIVAEIDVINNKDGQQLSRMLQNEGYRVEMADTRNVFAWRP